MYMIVTHEPTVLEVIVVFDVPPSRSVSPVFAEIAIEKPATTQKLYQSPRTPGLSGSVNVEPSVSLVFENHCAELASVSSSAPVFAVTVELKPISEPPPVEPFVTRMVPVAERAKPTSQLAAKIAPDDQQNCDPDGICATFAD